MDTLEINATVLPDRNSWLDKGVKETSGIFYVGRAGAQFDSLNEELYLSCVYDIS